MFKANKRFLNQSLQSYKSIAWRFSLSLLIKRQTPAKHVKVFINLLFVNKLCLTCNVTLYAWTAMFRNSVVSFVDVNYTLMAYRSRHSRWKTWKKNCSKSLFQLLNLCFVRFLYNIFFIILCITLIFVMLYSTSSSRWGFFMQPQKQRRWN